MEEFIYNLETLMKIRFAISSTYSEISKSKEYYECMEMINDLENEIIERTQEVDS